MKQEKEFVYNKAGIVHLRDQTHLNIQAARRLLDSARARGELIPLFRGAYVDRRNWPSEADFPHGTSSLRAALTRKRIECIAIGQANPNRVLTTQAAAIVHGLPLLDLPSQFRFASPTSRRTQRRTTHHGTAFTLGYAPLQATDSTVIEGARVTTLPRTVIDIAAEVPTAPVAPQGADCLVQPFRRFAEALALADAALRGSTGTLGVNGSSPAHTLMWTELLDRQLPPEWHFSIKYPMLAKPRYRAISPSELLQYQGQVSSQVSSQHAGGSRKIRGPRTAEILIAAASLSESVFESVAKALLIELQIPFVQQPRIVDDTGAMIARVDFLLPHHGVIIECDGRVKYEPSTTAPPSTADPWQDRRRDFALTNLGYQVIHLTWDDILGKAAPANNCRAANHIHTAMKTADDSPDQAPRGRWFDATTQLPSEAYRRFHGND